MILFYIILFIYISQLQNNSIQIQRKPCTPEAVVKLCKVAVQIENTIILQ